MGDLGDGVGVTFDKVRPSAIAARLQLQSACTTLLLLMFSCAQSASQFGLYLLSPLFIEPLASAGLPSARAGGGESAAEPGAEGWVRDVQREGGRPGHRGGEGGKPPGGAGRLAPRALPSPGGPQLSGGPATARTPQGGVNPAAASPDASPPRCCARCERRRLCWTRRRCSQWGSETRLRRRRRAAGGDEQSWTQTCAHGRRRRRASTRSWRRCAR